ncbi:hypothetical protein PBI_DRMANHATTAN_36 [Arthrobacter phage DrManhattan]|uniref:Uncharacterized protein n=1 Tax=Arthrobacter phage DrManhattan TaxID=2419955 RepID=A0A3G2KFJ4_9CAUD|nr:hypothetical protein HOU48_gp36 [Arthrobacter phage DrManhattan]AYN57756.1 hypothetical protein PBI_DRMANHATTAN_36 [Arthrobacter phage DrManhattan]
MQNDADPQTGSIFLSPRPADVEETFVLLPLVGEPGDYLAVFSDGSYTRWIPAGSRAD